MKLGDIIRRAVNKGSGAEAVKLVQRKTLHARKNLFAKKPGKSCGSPGREMAGQDKCRSPGCCKYHHTDTNMPNMLNISVYYAYVNHIG